MNGVFQHGAVIAEQRLNGPGYEMRGGRLYLPGEPPHHAGGIDQTERDLEHPLKCIPSKSKNKG